MGVGVREARVGGAPGVVVCWVGAGRGGGGGGVGVVGGGGGGGGGGGAEGGVAVGWVGAAGRGGGGRVVVVLALFEVQARVFSCARVFCSSADVVGPLSRITVAEVRVGFGAFHAGPEPRLSSRRSREAYARLTTALATADDTPFQTQWLRRALPTAPSLLGQCQERILVASVRISASCDVLPVSARRMGWARSDEGAR